MEKVIEIASSSEHLPPQTSLNLACGHFFHSCTLSRNLGEDAIYVSRKGNLEPGVICDELPASHIVLAL